VKVQPPSAPAIAGANEVASSRSTASAQGSQQAQAPQGSAGQLKLSDRFKDGFEPGKKIIDCFPPFPPQPKDTLSLRDHITASKLPESLSNPLNKVLLEKGEKDVQLSRDANGVMRDPEGAPLAKVQLKDGTTAYVSSNTNQYYLTDEREVFGRTNALGPLDIPENSKFSNSYFSDADVKSIERAARGNDWPFPRPPIDPLPYPPRPFPFPVDPLPFPRPIPDDWFGPIKKQEPPVLFAAGLDKASGA